MLDFFAVWVKTCELVSAKNRRQGKDTVAADKENDKVNAHHHVGEDGTAVCHDAVVHDSVPVFSCQNLKGRKERICIQRIFHFGHRVEKNERRGGGVGREITWKQVSRAWGNESKVLLFI